MDEQCEHHAKEMKEKTSLVDRVQIENQKLIEQLKKLRMRVDEQKDELQVAKAEVNQRCRIEGGGGGMCPQQSTTPQVICLR